jgi:hypothetical protein
VQVELVICGYPSRVRLAEWQQANLLSEAELPQLSEEQQARARKMQIPERAYAVGIKAAELATHHVGEKMEKVAAMIREAIQRRESRDELKSVIWDFYAGSFRFMVLHAALGQEVSYSMPTEIVDDVMMEKESAETRLRAYVDFIVGGWAN